MSGVIDDTMKKYPQERDLKEVIASSDRTKLVSDVLPDTDVVLFNSDIRGGIFGYWKKQLGGMLKDPKRDALVLMTTLGGSPDDAFRMIRSLQQRYKAIKIVLMGPCYSAGTLFALGANEIFMTYDANLGPLDVQIQKEDDIYRMSGECYRQALTDLADIAGLVFFKNFMALRTNSNLPLSTNTASKVSSEITTKLLSPITAQIEPQKLGEVMRSQSVGKSYALRLMKSCYSRDCAERIATSLSQEYPSHSTVIDADEARRIGLNVKDFNPTVDFGGCLERFSDYMAEPYKGVDIRLLNDEAV